MKKTLTKREVIKAVPSRWEKQYWPFKDEPQLFSVRNGICEPKSKEQIWKELKALDLETCRAEEVDSIIGNKSWTRLQCDQCREDVDWIYEFGQEPDYESKTAQICSTCLCRAYNQMPKGQDT